MRALHASRVVKASTLRLDRHRVHHARQAQLTLTATRPLHVRAALAAATVHQWTAYRALLVLTMTTRMHRPTAFLAASAHSHRQAPHLATKVVLNQLLAIQPLCDAG